MLTRRELMKGIGAAAALVATGLNVNAKDPPEDAEEWSFGCCYDSARQPDKSGRFMNSTMATQRKRQETIERAASAPLRAAHRMGYRNFKLTKWEETDSGNYVWVNIKFQVW